MGSSAASAAPDETKKISQNSVIKTSPETLRYYDMLADIPKSAILTIKNVSGNNISITPFMDFGEEYSAFLKFKLDLCDSGKCVPVTEATKVNILKDSSQELVVTITVTDDLPEALSSMSLENGLQITGEVHDSNKNIEIVPQNKAGGESVDANGSFSDFFMIMGFAGLLVIVCYGLVTFIQKNKTKEESV
jgi:hypothetical protein